jgi:hypothetical protein
VLCPSLLRSGTKHFPTKYWLAELGSQGFATSGDIVSTLIVD